MGPWLLGANSSAMLSRMPRQTEPSINNALGILLQGMMGSATVRSENVRAVAGHAGLQPDVIVTEPGRAPVIVEAEIEPARSVEAEAKSRLGLEVVEGRRTVEAVIALRYPEAVADSDDLGAALSGARLSYCVLRDDPSESRFPESGWITGSVSDLADLVRLVSVSQRDVDFAADALQQGIERVAAILDELDATQPGVTTQIARLLGMMNVPQTRRMACAIIANALVFHERIAGMSDNEIRPLSLVCGRGIANPKGETLAAWAAILDINYFPIFSIGRDILSHIPSGAAARILNTLELTAGEVSSAGVDNAHDLTGRIFQRLIVDRKYLATFYTLPASAALLARLAVSKMEGIDWSDAEAVGNLRIGDFACGTGALLSAAYEQIAARHERTGGSPVDSAPHHDAERTLRLRRDAVSYPHHRLDPFRRAPRRRVRGLASLHPRLRAAARRQREDRLPGAAAHLVDRAPVQHERTGPPDGQDRGADRRLRDRRYSRRGVRHGDHEPAIHSRHEPRGRPRRRHQPGFRGLWRNVRGPDGDGEADERDGQGDLLPRQRWHCVGVRGSGT